MPPYPLTDLQFCSLNTPSPAGTLRFWRPYPPVWDPLLLSGVNPGYPGLISFLISKRTSEFYIIPWDRFWTPVGSPEKIGIFDDL